MHLVDKTAVGLLKTSFLWFELTYPDRAQELQSTPPTRPNKVLCPGSCVFLSPCLHSVLTSPCGPSGRAGRFLQNLWVMNFSIPVSLVVCFWIVAHHSALCALLNKCSFSRRIVKATQFIEFCYSRSQELRISDRVQAVTRASLDQVQCSSQRETYTNYLVTYSMNRYALCIYSTWYFAWCWG